MCGDLGDGFWVSTSHFLNTFWLDVPGVLLQAKFVVTAT
jgi:hypothetical protein